MVHLSRKSRITASFALLECFLLLPCCWLLVTATSSNQAAEDPPNQQPPHILFVLIDDLGWGNVGFHQKANDDHTTNHPIQTPHMNQLVQEGVELNRHYVHHSCTGTRTALQSGRFPVHVQTSLKNPEEPSSGMPRNITGFAEYLQRQHYATHYVGKWDVGMATPKHTPKGRGYDTSLNYFEHKNDYWTQSCMQSKCCSILTQDGQPIKDLWDTDQPARHLNGTDYEELIFQKRMFEIVDQHAQDNTQQPLFLFYAPHVAHCPLQVPKSYLEQLNWMDNDEDMCQAQTKNIVGPHDNATKYSCRKQYHAMVQLLDDILGTLVDRLKHHGMWDSTVMVVTSDNGGPVDPAESAATNFPLRGGKYSDFEGGVRAVAFVSGGFLPLDRRGTVVNDPIHICDWYATLPALAGINVHQEEAQRRRNDNNHQNKPPLDAVDVWPLIAGVGDTSNRLLSTEKEIPLSTDALIIGDYKLLWHEGENITLAGYTYPNYPNAQTGKTDIRQQSINCSTGCLFNVHVDPSERNDMAASEPERVEDMKQRLVALRKGFFENDDRGLDSCPKGFNDSNKDLLCACWMAVNYYGGFFGPYQEVDITSSFMVEDHEKVVLVNEMS